MQWLGRWPAGTGAVALDRGRAVATFNSGQMELDDFYQSLKRLGHIHGKRSPRVQ
jgi:hypothetical protein